MRQSIYLLAIGIWIPLLVFLCAGKATAQEDCPAIEINCSERKFGDTSALKCAATVGGNVKKSNLTYRWSLSNQAPLKVNQERPDEVEIDLSANPAQTITVTVTVGGLAKNCDNTADFESSPIKLNEPESASEMDSSEEEEEEQPEPTSQPTANSIDIAGTCSEAVNEGATAYFSVRTNGQGSSMKPSYNWTLSRGRIKSGQGTSAILVDTTDLGGDIITATVRIEGLGAPLKLSCRTTVKRIPKAYKLNEINDKSLDEEALQLRRFALRLNIGLEEQAYIIATGRRGQSLEELRKRAERARDFLINQCGVSPDRIKGINAAVGTNETIQLWVIQNGASPPTARTSTY